MSDDDDIDESMSMVSEEEEEDNKKPAAAPRPTLARASFDENDINDVISNSDEDGDISIEHGDEEKPMANTKDIATAKKAEEPKAPLSDRKTTPPKSQEKSKVPFKQASPALSTSPSALSSPLDSPRSSSPLPLSNQVSVKKDRPKLAVPPSSAAPASALKDEESVTSNDDDDDDDNCPHPTPSAHEAQRLQPPSKDPSFVDRTKSPLSAPLATSSKSASPLPPLQPTSSVDLDKALRSRVMPAALFTGGASSSGRDSNEDFFEDAASKRGKVDAAVASKKFEEMTRRHKEESSRRKESPSSPMVTKEDLEKALDLEKATLNKLNLDCTDKRTGLCLPSPLTLFLQYDADRTGGINRNEFGQMLFDMDHLSNLSKKKRDEYIKKEFEIADLNHDNLISIDEFFLYFYSVLCFKFPVLRTGVNPGADLLNIYMRYCSFGKPVRSEEMDGNQFAKLCVDCKIVNGRSVTRAICDIVWFRARAELSELRAWKRKGSEYITPKMLYPQFLFALLRLAEKRKSGFEEVVMKILDSVGALPMPSSSDFLVLTNTGKPEQQDEFVERPRGLPKPSGGEEAAKKRLERMKAEEMMTKHLQHACDPPTRGEEERYSEDEEEDDAPLGPPATGPKAERGEDRNRRYDGAEDSVPPTPGSQMRGKGGGGSFLTDGKTKDLEDSARGGGGTEGKLGAGSPGATASPQIPRQAGQYVTNLPSATDELPDYKEELVPHETLKKWGLVPKQLTLPRRGPSALDHPDSLLAVRKMNPDDLMMALKDVFEQYNLWEQGTSKSNMDKTRFAKALRDARLISEQPGGLSASAVDAIFFKVLPPASDSINFVKFIDALRFVSNRLRTSLNLTMEKIVLIGSPVLSDNC